MLSRSRSLPLSLNLYLWHLHMICVLHYVPHLARIGERHNRQESRSESETSRNRKLECRRARIPCHLRAAQVSSFLLALQSSSWLPPDDLAEEDGDQASQAEPETAGNGRRMTLAQGPSLLPRRTGRRHCGRPCSAAGRWAESGLRSFWWWRFFEFRGCRAAERPPLFRRLGPQPESVRQRAKGS